MKRTSRAGIRNAAARAEKRASKPPPVSKYAAKNGAVPPENPSRVLQALRGGEGEQ